MEAEYDGGALGMLQAQALCADGNASIGADLEGGSNAPNIRPPRASRGWTLAGRRTERFLFWPDPRPAGESGAVRGELRERYDGDAKQ